MIVTENLTIDEKVFVRTYSDSGYMVQRDGVEYSEAIDPAEFGRTYIETTTLIESGMTETEEKAKAYDILMGVSE